METRNANRQREGRQSGRLHPRSRRESAQHQLGRRRGGGRERRDLRSRGRTKGLEEVCEEVRSAQCAVRGAQKTPLRERPMDVKSDLSRRGFVGGLTAAFGFMGLRPAESW